MVFVSIEICTLVNKFESQVMITVSYVIFMCVAGYNIYVNNIKMTENVGMSKPKKYTNRSDG